MLDALEFDFEYEDEISLGSSELDADSDPGHGSASLSPCSSHVESVSLSVAGITLDDAKRPEKSPNMLSNVSYRPLSLSWYVYEHMVRPAQHLQRTFMPQLSVEEVTMLLHQKKWLSDEVTSDYFSDWPRLRDACGLPKIPRFQHEIRQISHFSCPICCEAGTLDVFSLSCGHEFCAPCYKRYVALALARGALIRCMDTKCRLSLHYKDVALLLDICIENESIDDEKVPDQDTGSDPQEDESDSESVGASEHEFLDEYDAQFETPDFHEDTSLSRREPLLANPLLIAAARVAIDALRSRFRWCPAIDCVQLVEILSQPKIMEDDEKNPENGRKSVDNDLSQIAVVTCAQGHEFCFNCHYENHLPCPCWLAKSWIKRCEDDSETVNWIDANTQGCPRCQAVIEKNGGCNHIICVKCSYEFCWICLGDWGVHKSSFWQCNRFDPKEVEETKKKRSSKQNSLSRYLHFYRRFSVHQVSMDGDKRTLRIVHRCMLQYMKAQTLSSERTGSWNDVQFLSDAIRSLTRGRKTLMWTYAFAFYLNKSNFSEIFEGMQDYLNKAVEDLSRLFEEIQVLDAPQKTAAKISLKKADIMGLAALVSRRRDLLMECAQTGIQQSTLLFMTS